MHNELFSKSSLKYAHHMKDYREFRFGWLIFVFTIPIQILIAVFYFSGIGDNPLSANDFFVVNLVILAIFILFYGLTTKISNTTIRIAFGIGLIRKRIRLSRIKSVEAVKTPWYYGWGIRFIPNGMLYNISGSEGVELKFADTNRVIRIGTKDALNLKQEIEKRLSSK